MGRGRLKKVGRILVSDINSNKKCLCRHYCAGGNDSSKSSAGFAHENKLIHPVADFQTASKPKGKT
ncbi:hypothetical protein HMPREF2936_11080 [Neisseria sp. HMSC064F04]|uniref:Uncharacterized protein n=1 Tax=Neisseria mucosa (strain ATCC 25996 / DSM 4631 / NCTC 10774 / M26) TaxID=546266 RepID=D2ZZI4_NEIM2|nr:hypothetical protein NEIMUCOT_06060 [Neisseria mucosa ATCC 25996]OHR44695.1 hypothetical protein HMPREF2936_11080 [Neisseria sp. HMSC064F04]